MFVCEKEKARASVSVSTCISGGETEMGRFDGSEEHACMNPHMTNVPTSIDRRLFTYTSVTLALRSCSARLFAFSMLSFLFF